MRGIGLKLYDHSGHFQPSLFYDSVSLVLIALSGVYWCIHIFCCFVLWLGKAHVRLTEIYDCLHSEGTIIRKLNPCCPFSWEGNAGFSSPGKAGDVIVDWMNGNQQNFFCVTGKCSDFLWFWDCSVFLLSAYENISTKQKTAIQFGYRSF